MVSLWKNWRTIMMRLWKRIGWKSSIMNFTIVRSVICVKIKGRGFYFLLSFFYSDLLKPKRVVYDGDSVRDLLRAIRNMASHEETWSRDVKKLLGSTAHSFVTYFTSRFPQLLLHTYEVMSACAAEERFKKYYP